jgi:hypothetical protein
MPDRCCDVEIKEIAVVGAYEQNTGECFSCTCYWSVYGGLSWKVIVNGEWVRQWSPKWGARDVP